MTNDEKFNALEAKSDLLAAALAKAIHQIEGLNHNAHLMRCMIIDIAIRAGWSQEEFTTALKENHELVQKAVKEAKSGSDMSEAIAEIAKELADGIMSELNAHEIVEDALKKAGVK
jgi:predicted HAD superfamily Cof-like phosphohydrolase